MEPPLLFSGWEGVLRAIAATALGYLGVVVLLRASGKRTLSKMNAFDLVVTVALGSTLATIALSDSVAVAEGLAAVAVLVMGQLVLTWLQARSSLARRLLKARPELVFHRGEFLRDPMLRMRVAEVEVRAAARASGHASMKDVGAVVLETDGSFTVLGDLPQAEDTLRGVGAGADLPGSDRGGPGPGGSPLG